MSKTLTVSGESTVSEVVVKLIEQLGRNYFIMEGFPGKVLDRFRSEELVSNNTNCYCLRMFQRE